MSIVAGPSSGTQSGSEGLPTMVLSSCSKVSFRGAERRNREYQEIRNELQPAVVVVALTSDGSILLMGSDDNTRLPSQEFESSGSPMATAAQLVGAGMGYQYDSLQFLRMFQSGDGRIYYAFVARGCVKDMSNGSGYGVESKSWREFSSAVIAGEIEDKPTVVPVLSVVSEDQSVETS